MKKLILLITVMFVINSCTERMTKQFILDTTASDSESQIVENWVVRTPQLIAYKNKKVDEIEDIPYLYWLRFNVNSISNLNSNKMFSIDSVGLKFESLDSVVWRSPTRIVPYKESKNEKYLAFEFYKDMGILIPESISKIQLFFDAILTDTITKDQTIHPVSFDMIRQDTVKLTPFMIQ